MTSRSDTDSPAARADVGGPTRDIGGPTPGEQFALAFLMFLTTGVFGFLQPFVPLYLGAAGLKPTEFGLVTAVGTGAALLVQPILGRLSDRLDRRRPFIMAAAVWAGCAYLCYRYAHGFWSFALLTAAGVNGFQYLNGAGGALVGRLAQATGAGGGSAYVRYRVWGSVGYVAVAITAGLLVNRYLPSSANLTRADLEPVFTYGPLLFFAVALVAIWIPDLRSGAVAGATGGRPAAEDVPRPDARNLDWFLLTYFLYSFGLYGASAYLPMYMKQMGASPLLITAMFAGGVVCEVLVMSRVGRWTDTYGRRPALAASFLLMPLRLLLYVPATGPAWIMAVQTLHGINFGIIGTIAVVFVNDLARPGERGALQARLLAAAGIGTALGPVVCGWLVEQIGVRGMFAAMSSVGFLAAGVFLRFVGESNPAAVPHRHGLIRRLSGRG
jgi:MFS transporter, PPP family, 3-phenylpropionic acid transporter